jgi:hypothetical protein
MIINNIGSYINTAGCAIGGFGGIIESPTTQTAPFVGPLDALIAQGASLRHASSVRRLLSSYTGSACRLVESVSGTFQEADIPFLADGTLDFTTVYILGGGSLLTWSKAYDQSGFNRHAAQLTYTNQPSFGDYAISRGAMEGTGSQGKWLNVDLSPTASSTNRPFFVLAVVNVAATTVTRVLLGSGVSASLYLRQNSMTFQSAWPTPLTNSLEMTGKQTLGALVNFASSANYLNGVSQITGDTGSSSLDTYLVASRIGRSTQATTAWCNTINQAIAEFIVFNNDPTTLPGWPAFVAAQNAHFGII